MSRVATSLCSFLPGTALGFGCREAVPGVLKAVRSGIGYLGLEFWFCHFLAACMSAGKILNYEA